MRAWLADARAWLAGDVPVWLARHLPSWVPPAIWYSVMLVVGVFWVTFLVLGVLGASMAVVDTDPWKGLRALWGLAVGASSAAWWFEEARTWRETLTQRKH